MDKPLVTVAVLSFNSASTILQTLQSIYEQTYLNLELIISDDYSSDNTVTVCEDWVDRNKKRFYDVQILTIDHNTGTTANTNRAYHAAKGKWIKPIAADDLLKPEAIESYLIYCMNEGVEVCVSRLDYFGDHDRILQKEVCYSSFYKKYKTLTREKKYNLLLSECALPMPGMFISLDLIRKINYADESYAFSEEWPLYLKILSAGYDIPYISDRLVEYRCENGCLSIGASYDDSIKGKSYKAARKKVFEDGYRFYIEYRRPRLLSTHRYYEVWSQDVSYKIISINSKESKEFRDRVVLFFLRLVSPLTYKNVFNYINKVSSKEFMRKIKSSLKI